VNWACRELALNSPDYRASLILREEILRRPLGLPFRPEDTAHDDHSFHLGCYREETLVGVLVLEPLDETMLKMRQVAVAADTQGQGAGSDLVAFAERFAREKGFRTIVANARQEYHSFYVKRGYHVRGGPFIEVTIPHYAVAKEL
jgi:predicted GNAT family N-acyltransferase